MQNIPKHKQEEPIRSINNKHRILLVALILSIIALCMLVLQPWARYSSAGQHSDSARVAQFVVTATDGTTTEEEKSLVLNDVGLEKTYPFSASNQNAGASTTINEVDTDYDVIITFPNEFSFANSGATMSLISDSGTPSDASDDITKTVGKDGASDGVTVSSDKKTYTFTSFGTFKANVARTDNLTLKFVLDAENAKAGTWEGISVAVKATQID